MVVDKHQTLLPTRNSFVVDAGVETHHTISRTSPKLRQGAFAGSFPESTMKAHGEGI
jgi:hypothetical protein